MTARNLDRITPWLIAGAGAASAAGLAGYFIGLGSSADPEGLRALLSRSIAEGPWGVASSATLGFAALSLSLGVADTILRRVDDRRRLHFEGIQTGSVRETIAEVKLRVDECVAAGPLETSSAFDEILRGAIRVEASDIHMSPTPAGLSTTYRVQGSLHEVCLVPMELGKRLATRVKVLARLDPYARGPQDGRLVRELDGARVEARVSSLLAEGGQRIVLRLVSGSLGVPELAQLGFEPNVVESLTEMLKKPQGLLFVTGPVGSGKTTTLYSALQHIAKSRGRTTSLVTLEDPIELQLPFATQTQINAQMRMSFAQTLRSVLRQDPNVLMLGEIRDRETAEIAVQAGLTGHLLLTTLHAETSAGVFARLIEMDVEPFILASAAIGALSQRLVRTLCTSCRRPAAPDHALRERFERLGVTLGPGEYFEAVGCDYCEGLGFSGRAPIAELLVVSSELKQAVHERIPTTELQRLAMEQGMVPLVASGLTRAVRGETTLSEVLRVAG